MRILLVLTAAAALAGCAKHEAGDEPPDVRVDVKTALVRSGVMARTVTATGTTVLRKETQLRSPVTGVIVRFALFNGDRVAAGEPVAEIRPKEAQAALQGAEELLRAAKSARESEEARRALEMARANTTTVTVHSPIAGVLTAREKNEMEVVSEGESIATVVDPASVIFVADAPSAALRELRTGQEATIRFGARPGSAFAASVHRIEPNVNPNDQTAKVQLSFSGPTAALQGSLFGEASIVVGRKQNALIVPAAALLRDDELNATSIMLVEHDSIAVRVPVTPGIRSDSTVEVTGAGVHAGSIVITEGHYGLPDSTRVRMVK